MLERNIEMLLGNLNDLETRIKNNKTDMMCLEEENNHLRTQIRMCQKTE